jgi:predicted DsbA family dithiol-disulfide isomerase
VTEVEVFADVWCPFTHVGLRRFVEQRSDRGADVGLRVRSWPLELVNGAPLDADFVAEEIEEIRAVVAPDLFEGFDPTRFPTTTLPALQLTAVAYRSSASVGEAVALELRDRLFERGEDIGSSDVLVEVAASHGLAFDAGTDLVEPDWEEGRDRGVLGSPHFFTPTGDFFCPALDIEKVDGHLRITADPEGFDAFLQSCLSR